MIDTLLQILAGQTVDALNAAIDAVSSGITFSAQTCSKEACPGSSYTSITAAWADIGYMTHADFVHFVWNTSFGLWAAVLYVLGAVGALISVSINQPPRTYMWFFLGPAIYSFLVGTPESVQGVAWRVANRDMAMESVWRDAETGLANTALVNDLGINVYRDQAPSGQYQVAWMMVFLDGIFSEATNNLINWIGMQRREGNGGSDTNLFSLDGEEGPWYLLANLKWGMIENIVGVTARDPDVRDSLVTFLTSECGDHFKRGINSGAYSAASQSRGANLPQTVFVVPNLDDSGGLDDQPGPVDQYAPFVKGLDTDAIPTPRSLIRLMNSPSITGSFRKFSAPYNSSQAYEQGRLSEIVCSEYLYTIIQSMRWEAGHAYHQLIRSFPDGFQSAPSALKTLFYGWNLRPSADADMIDGDELETYTKHLILAHLIRNELMFAPQVTETGQRFAPSEQTRNFSESFVRSQGSRAKYGELYNWAVMMPYIQGILTYLILIGYPFAAMLMVIPGYWKAFFTWIAFFAWVKLWDVGFAIVHTLERSVWAMIGNHSAMARVGRRLVNTAQDGRSDVDVRCPDGGDIPGRLSQLCAIPEVTSRGGQQDQDAAWFTLDQILVVAGSLDLDLSNGYYIYIMAALYFAVPTVTGQLVLGAKASLGGIATQAMGQSAGEAGAASKSGTIGEGANRLATNQSSIGQAAMAKSYRQSGLAQKSFDAMNAGMDADVRGAEIGFASRAASGVAEAQENTMQAFGSHSNFTNNTNQTVKSAMGLGGGLRGADVQSKSGQSLAGDTSGSGEAVSGVEPGENGNEEAITGRTTGSGGESQSGAKKQGWFSYDPNRSWSQYLGGKAGAKRAAVSFAGAGTRALMESPGWGMAGLSNSFAQDYYMSKSHAAAAGIDFGMQKTRTDLMKGGFQQYGQRLGQEADFEANMAAWDTKNAFATHISGAAGVAGFNPGNIAPGIKPTDMAGLAASGSLGANSKQAAYYSGGMFMSNLDGMIDRNRSRGSSLYLNNWQPFSYKQALGGGVAAAGRNAMQVPGLISDAGKLLTGGDSEMRQGMDMTRGRHGITSPEQLQQIRDSLPEQEGN